MINSTSWRQPTAVALAGLATLGTTVILVGAAPAHAASTLTYQVTNYDHDGTYGVYLRSSGDIDNVTRNGAHYVTYGTKVQLACWTTGSSVGPYANRVWDKVKVLSGRNSGKTGYVSEHWLNTPVKTNQHVAGEPKCGSSTSSHGLLPEIYKYCDSSVPWSNAAFTYSYDGLNFGPSYNSSRTTCRDLVVSQGEYDEGVGWFPAFWYHQARPVNWDAACSIYWGSKYYAHESHGRYWCYKR